MELKGIEYGHNCILEGYFNTTMGKHEKIGGSIVRDTLQEQMEDLILTLNSLMLSLKKICIHGSIKE